MITPEDFDKTVSKMREFFKSKGFLEVHTQTRLSILAACEDPKTISTYDYAGQVWPLPQTGQMWLEYEMLTNPEKAPGYFCVSTSYRNEPNPVPGRHDKIFPMFEFELKGDMEDLIQLERELLEWMGFKTPNGDCDYPRGKYVDVARTYGVKELENEHEENLERDHGSVFFLTDFPNYTSPFWNMKQSDEVSNEAKKVDVIIHGIETIGSAERSCDPEEMKRQFYTISEGGYADILFSKFSKQRVEEELNEFMGNKFFKRSGGGIGVTRMIRAMKLSHLI
ncbi:transposase [bacterium]|nr:transposase [bacterium]